jgi:hypothetical protein
MNTTGTFGFALSCAFLAAACGAAPTDVTPGRASADLGSARAATNQQQPSAPADLATAAATATSDDAALYTCVLDSDCVAVTAAPGCCDNGRKTAVAAEQVEAWDRANACVPTRRICPMYKMLDKRVPECDDATHRCVMVAPEDVRCDGFRRNAHQCPDGYACNFEQHVSDVPGVCQPSEPAGDDKR